ncbi:MAG: ATP-binding protein [Mariprofundus sp.]|nr:ATP-binding protein [Mariprofundus sp.]
MTDKPNIQDVAFPTSPCSQVGKLQLQLNCNSDCLHVLRSIVTVMCARAHISKLRSNRVAVAIDELFANIAEHAYGGKPGKVEFESHIDDSGEASQLIFDFRDYAALNWAGCMQEVATQPIDHENLTPGGLGLKLICSVADACEHHILADGNHWRLIFKLSTGDHHES